MLQRYYNLFSLVSYLSLNLFKKIENEGGYYKSLNKKNLFNEILTNSKSVQRQYKLKEKILIGYNKFIDE